MTRYQHLKQFVDFRGLDLRSSELLRPKGFSREDLNTMHSPQGALTHRFGNHIRATGYGWAGMWNFKATNMLQVDADEIIGAGGPSLLDSKRLWRQAKFTATFANTNAAATTVSFYYDNALSHHVFKIIRGGSTLLSYDCSAKTLAQLITAIAAISGCTLTTSATTTGLADYLSLKDSTVVAATTGTTLFDVYFWEVVRQPTAIFEFLTADVSTGNDTIDIHSIFTSDFGKDRYYCPLRDSDSFGLVSNGGALPTGLSAGTTYYVVNSTKTTIQVAATLGGSPINITGAGGGGFVVPDYNPFVTLENYAVCLTSDPSRFQNVSSVDIRSVRYFSSGPYKRASADTSNYRDSAVITKYDGLQHYAAGLPKPYFNVATDDSSGGPYIDPKGSYTPASITNTTNVPWYKARFAYVDKAGNYILGPLSDPRSGNSGAGKFYVGTSGLGGKGWRIPQRLGMAAGYCVQKSGGSLTATTFTGSVGDGFGNVHSLRAGDIAYFWDSRQGRFIQRECLSGTSGSNLVLSTKSLDLDATSPNFDDGDTPTVLNKAVFSANLRILIYRTNASAGADSGQPYYLVDEFPFASPYSNVYYDEMDEDALGATLLEPAYIAGPTPRCKYLAKFNEQLIATGDDTALRTIYFDDIESPEGFPPVTHSFDLPRLVTAVRQTGEVLAATTDRSIHIASGDLTDLKFRVDTISDNIGCRSHESMKEFAEGILAFDTDKGPHVLYGGRKLEPLGMTKYPDGKIASRLEPFFTANYNTATSVPAWTRSVGMVLPGDRLYVLFVPIETTTGYSVRSATVGTGSLAFVYDFGRDSWRRWSNVDYSAACVQDNRIYSAGRPYDVTGPYLNILSYSRQLQRDAGVYNFVDHTEAIVWKWQAHWEALGQPGILKKFLRCRISSHEARLAASTQMDLNSYVDYAATTQANDDTLTWASQIDLDPKLTGESMRAIMIEFTSQRYYEPMLISGYELEAVAPFRQVFKE